MVNAGYLFKDLLLLSLPVASCLLEPGDMMMVVLTELVSMLLVTSKVALRLLGQVWESGISLGDRTWHASGVYGRGNTPSCLKASCRPCGQCGRARSGALECGGDTVSLLLMGFLGGTSAATGRGFSLFSWSANHVKNTNVITGWAAEWNMRT